MLELLDILDWSVAEANLPFVVGIADKLNGVRCSGSVGHGGLLGARLPRTRFPSFLYIEIDLPRCMKRYGEFERAVYSQLP